MKALAIIYAVFVLSTLVFFIKCHFLNKHNLGESVEASLWLGAFTTSIVVVALGPIALVYKLL